MENIRTVMGGNNPPNPIDDAMSPFDDARAEAETWLDGTAVENEGQMKAVDALIKEMKGARKAVEAAEESAAKPIYDQWKAEKAKFAPTISDLDRIVKGLVSIVDTFKRKLAAEKAEAARKAEAIAWEKTRAAQEASRLADAGNIDATREADRIAQEAEDAQRRAMAAAKDTVKGLRTVTRYEIADQRALLHFIAQNHRDDLVAFLDEWARKNHKNTPAPDGLRVWSEKEAF